MIATNKLRFVERLVPITENAGTRVRILQQWWEQKGMTMNLGWGGEMPIGEIKGEWRDVPIEEEDT
jgi:hypothetical protein